MKKELLQERITKAQQTIVKKNELIAKREKAISKKVKELEELGYTNINDSDEMIALRNNGKAKENWNQAYWVACDMTHYKESIRDAQKAIKEEEVKIVKYQNMLEVEIQKENSINELPELFNNFQNMLIEAWDKFDKARRDEIKEAVKTLNKLEYNEWKQERKNIVAKYGWNYDEKASETDEHIHQSNVKDSRDIILDLINRVSDKTGEILDYSGLHLNYNNAGYSILNGYVKGKNGSAYVDSILAGGYNIQRLHIRVLVK